MFTTLLAAAALIVPALAQGSCTGFQLDTPTTLNQCSNTQVTWSGGNPNFWLISVNGSDPCGDAITDYGTHGSWSMTIYNADYVKGDEIQLYLQSSDGCESYTNTITVGDGPTSCLSASQLAVYKARTGGSTAAANNAEGAPSTTGSAKPSSTSSKNDPLSGAVANGENAATMATFNLPVLALSAAAGLIALL